jgi:hypothetical protein
VQNVHASQLTLRSWTINAAVLNDARGLFPKSRQIEANQHFNSRQRIVRQACRYVLASPFSPLHRTTYSRQVPTCVHTYHIQRSSYPHPVLPVRQQPSRPYPPTTRTQVQPVHLAVLSNGRMRHEHTYTHPPTSSQPSRFRAAATFQYYVYMRHIPLPRPPRHALSPLLSNNDLPPTSLYQLNSYLLTSLFVTGNFARADFSLPVHPSISNCSSTCLRVYTFTLALNHQT